MFELDIALRHISARKRQTVFSIMAVALAIAIIVVTMSMLTGFRNDIIELTVENSPHIIVNPIEDDEEFIHLYNYQSSLIAQKEGVQAVSPCYMGPAALDHRDNAFGITLQGVVPEAEDAVMKVSNDVIAGSFRELSRTRYGIVIGDQLAEDLEVRVGDWVDALSPDAETTSFKVVGIVDTGTSVDESLAYARLDSVQDYFDESGVVSTIRVRVVDVDTADVIADSIEEDTGLDAESWIEANSGILELLNTQQAFVWIFYFLIYTVAGFGIANTLITVVMDKKKEIGMLMAMGTSKKSITLIFLLESSILGAIGVILGCILGYIIAVTVGVYSIEIPSEVYLGLTTLPVDIDLKNFLYAGVFSFFINILAGYYPARRASQLDPVEAMQGE